MTSNCLLVTARFDGRLVAAVAAGEALYRPPWLRTAAGVIDALRAWPELSDRWRSWRPDEADRLTGAQVVQPLQYPPKVLCSGPNFTDHLAEMGESGLGDAWSAYFFLKPPTTTLVADGADVLIDDPETAKADWEGELAVIIGIGGRRVRPEDAMRHVAGYMVANDISLRAPHRRDTPAKPFQWDWLASKGADTSLPIGPGLVPAWTVADPQKLRIRTRVNGELRQDGSTADMVLGVAELIADASRLVTLEPGDVILTGTPAGVGASTGRFLSDGDKVEVEIEGVGAISNTIRRRPPEHEETP
ncbi:fumarylacetoacetate hydrolase family protein [Dactylosporangium sp. CA-092794]|uniref:fumarylacetoacetate hydrolase family protein n=1 Tax=Dactylosporangium sp. CA-092794 TaxID=3239929 RepID=UPI003D8F3E67